MIYDLIIIGSGAAGLSAGIYAGRYRTRALVIGKEFGGETAKAGAIENYPGFQSVDGYELMDLMKQQAAKLNVEMLDAEVTSVTRQGHCFSVIADKKTYEANAIIFAVGAERRRLGLPNEKELTGRGVHYCVTCDGPVYTGKTIAMVGGGDASVKGVNLAAEYVKKLFLIVRGKEVTAEPINLEHLKKLGDKVEIILETEVKELIGKNKLEKLILSRPYKGSAELIVDGLFVEIGAIPNVELAKSLGVELDERGYIKTDNMMQTNVDGVFAAGDAVNHFGLFKQDITAAAMGAVAATSAYNDHKVHGELCSIHMQPSPLDKE
ncbi:MAG: FAD-dependent oxidoreductase [Candidatus Harrisonbacteria bacterium]|nr:FAD-dependent oxidoreductase [Candidatus Harrisonbacteria bacterium]